MLYRPYPALPGLTMPCPTTHGRQCPVRARPGDLRPVSHVPAIHLARQSPFYRPPGHIRSRDGTDLCPSSDPNPSRHRSKAHWLARWFAGRSPTCNRPATHNRQSPVSDWLVPGPTLSCNSSCTAIAILRASRGHSGHIDSRDGVNLCPSSVANPSRQHSRAYPLAR